MGYNWFAKPDQIFDEIAQLKAEGFTAFKMRIGSAWGLAGMTVSKFGDHLTRVRAALGDEIDLMLDANCRFRTVAGGPGSGAHPGGPARALVRGADLALRRRAAPRAMPRSASQTRCPSRAVRG